LKKYANGGDHYFLMYRKDQAMQIHTHLFLVDDNLIPNITPVLDERFRPSRIFLMSYEGCPNAERLKRILNSLGVVAVDYWSVKNCWDIDQVRQRSQKFIDTFGSAGVALNATCGARPMNLAAYEIFRTAEKPIYCVHPAVDHVVWLNSKERKSFDIADRIKLPEYLAAHDLRLVSSSNEPIKSNFIGLTNTLIKRADYFANSLGVMNGLAAESAEGLVSSVLGKKNMDQKFCELVELFTAQKLVHRTKNDRLRFEDERSRFFVNGGWLEEHVYNLVEELRAKIPSIQDVARNLVIEWDENRSPVTNELDVAFLADNRFYLIECKTKQFLKNKGPGAEANIVLYRLHTLRSCFGGEAGRAMFISFRSLTKAPRQRADEYKIKLCDWNSLRRLDQVIESWVKS